MAADLFGLEQKPKRTNDRHEAAALVEVLQAFERVCPWCVSGGA